MRVRKMLYIEVISACLRVRRSYILCLKEYGFKLWLLEYPADNNTKFRCYACQKTLTLSNMGVEH